MPISLWIRIQLDIAMDNEGESDFGHFPLVDALDHDILMHREAHFGGQFSIMIDYYKQGGKGAQPDFDRDRIEYLANLEQQLKQNLAVLMLEGREIQKVADARQMYDQLRQIYTIQHPKTLYPRLIADLILTEEEKPESEILAIVSEQEHIVPALIQVLRCDELYDPLFPGYGHAPSLAVECLGRIGNHRAIPFLFAILGQGDFFLDDQIISALKMIGSPARAFLLPILKRRPLNEDNCRAAMALLAFKDDEEVAATCLDLLQHPDVQQDLCLATYLVLGCTDLKDPMKRQLFIQTGTSPLLAPLKEDIREVIQGW
jgi:hypothetical protein